jgi:hypothetical protein
MAFRFRSDIGYELALRECTSQASTFASRQTNWWRLLRVRRQMLQRHSAGEPGARVSASAPWYQYGDALDLARGPVLVALALFLITGANSHSDRSVSERQRTPPDDDIACCIEATLNSAKLCANGRTTKPVSQSNGSRTFLGLVKAALQDRIRTPSVRDITSPGMHASRVPREQRQPPLASESSS